MLKSQLNSLVQLASADGLMSEKEIRFVKMLGKVNGLSDAEIDDIMKNPQPADNSGVFSDDQKFEYIYSLVQLMKADGQVFKSEIAFCERIAEQLGYSSKVIAELSSHIYSDPSITGDRDKIKARAQKYLK